MRVMLLYSMLLLPAISAPVYGQSGQGLQTENADAKLPAYAVVSIKPNKSGSGNLDVDSNNDIFQAVNISLTSLIENTYGVKKDLISGVPKPLDTARFDIAAKIVDPDLAALKQLTPVQYRAMLKPFLIERFHLKVHTEIKQLPVYDLVVVKGGPKFRESPAGFQGSSAMHANNRELTATHIPIASLTEFLFNQVHRTVIDTTGLTGKHGLVLK